MVELELLAATWAVAKCRGYLLGLQHFELWVDHQPLEVDPRSAESRLRRKSSAAAAEESPRALQLHHAVGER